MSHDINHAQAAVEIPAEIVAAELKLPAGTRIVECAMTPDGGRVILYVSHPDLPARGLRILTPRVEVEITRMVELGCAEYTSRWKL